MKEKAVNLQVEDKLTIVTIDDKLSPQNTWSDDVYEGMMDAINEIRDLTAAQAVEGVIIISGKPNNFHVGASLKGSGRPDTKLEKMRTIEFNQAVYNKISSLKVPVVAAIDGHALGGGLELTLACTARIAKDSKKTIVGLPEATIGLFPAGGGTQRLPRLIGYPAIDYILNAEAVSAKQALSDGIIDKMVPDGADLLKEAKAFIKDIISGKVQLNRVEYDFSDIDRVIEEARKKVLKKFKGRLLPAPKAILTLMEQGLKLPLNEALELEKRLFIDVALSPEHKGHVNTFLLKAMTNDPRKMMTPGFQPKELKKVAVLGVGTMGRGIVINLLRDSDMTILIKDSPEAMEAAKKFILMTLSGLYDKGKIKTQPEELMKRVLSAENFGSEFADVDISIEAIYENLEAKKELYTALTKAVRKDSLIASNTSGIPLNTLAEFVENPERFGGLHYFSPVWMMELVEVVRGKYTTQNTVDNLLHFAGKMKKRPLICNDNPGFVVNAVNASFTRSGLRYIEEGNSVAKVNAAFQTFGFPVGPIKLIDEVGIDVSSLVYKNRGEDQKTLQNMVDAGRFGLKKNGKGFFLADGSVDPEAMKLVAKREPVDRDPEQIPIDYLRDQIAVAKDLLDRNIVDGPAIIDIGMLFGTGYPPDKGGPLKWADLIGVSEEVYGKKFYED